MSFSNNIFDFDLSDLIQNSSGQLPKKVRSPTPKRNKPTDNKTDNNTKVVHSSVDSQGKVWYEVDTQTDASTIEFEVADNFGDMRSPILNNDELKRVKALHLKHSPLEVAAIVKIQWAKNCSNRIIFRYCYEKYTKKGRRGFGQSTIDKLVAIFNSVEREAS